MRKQKLLEEKEKKKLLQIANFDMEVQGPSVMSQIDPKKQELLQKAMEEASEKIDKLPIAAVFQALKDFQKTTRSFTFTQIYLITLLQLKLSQRRYCQIVKEARFGKDNCVLLLIYIIIRKKMSISYRSGHVQRNMHY